jgi:hypothetical protein
MIPMTELGLGEEMFTHIDDTTDPPRQMSFAVDRIFAKCEAEKLEPVFVPIDLSFVEYLCKFRGVELPRVFRLTDQDRIKPVLLIKYPYLSALNSTEYLLIDGCHRYVRAALDERTLLLAYVIEERAFWEPFLVSGVPTETLEILLAKKRGLTG